MDKNIQHDIFQNPTPEFGPGAYWFWQRIPTRKEIDAQLEEMKHAGFTTFYIQARLAFPIEQYLNEEYLAAYRYAIEGAQRLELKAGIYDDYNWNSGHAGGLTVRGHDEYRERQLFWASTSILSTTFSLEISDIKTLMGDTLGGVQGHWTYEGGKPIWDEWQVIRVIGYPEDMEARKKMNLIDLSKFCTVRRLEEDRCIVEVSLPDDRYFGLKITAFVCGRCMTSRHINYLFKDATNRFIEVGYEPYKKAVGEYFGSTVFCMFMDHPHAGFYSWKQREGNIQNTLMYDDSLIEAFENEHGYPIETAWLSFLLPISKESVSIRGDFFDTYGRLARENFLGQVSGWAHKNGLQFAGHELFGFLGIWGFYGGYHVVDQRTDFGGDYFGIGGYKDISTVDAYNSNPQVDAKIGDSVARASGNHGCMLEQYYFNTDPRFPGAIGVWNLTMDEMRAQALRHTFFGTKQFIFHGFYLTDQEGGFELLASSRFDFAPGINYEPWFSQHSAFAREISRLSAFIYAAEPLTDIAVLYPLSTFWVEGTDGVFGEQSAIWNQWLLENGIGFDIVDENQLHFSRKDPGKVQAGPNSYRILILPGVKTLRNSTLAADIKQFVKSGGTLLLSGVIPTGTVEEGQNSIRKMFENLIHNHPNARFFTGEHEILGSIAGLLDSLLPTQPRVRHSEEEQKRVWSWTGKDEAGLRIALFNDSELRQRLEIEIPDDKVMQEKWDLTSGERSGWLWYERSNSITWVKIDLQPREVACLRMNLSGEVSPSNHLVETPLRVVEAVDHGQATVVRLLAERAGKYEVVTAGKTTQGAGISDPVHGESTERIIVEVPALPKNLDLNDNWTLTIAGRAEKTSVKVERGWEQQGFEDYGGEGIYETNFDMARLNLEWRKWDWKLVFPGIFTSAEVILNGKPVGRLPWPPYEIVLPQDALMDTDNRLIVRVFNTGGNHYYSGSPYHVGLFPSGIVGYPSLKPVKVFRIDKFGKEIKA